MVNTAEANGIGWVSALEYIREQGPWDASVLQLDLKGGYIGFRV